MMASLVIVLLNEELSIPSLLLALERQTVKPDEIIFIDGGSIDKTTKIIKDWSRHKNNVKILIKRGVSIAGGRNFGISKASGEIIVHTDAGCIPHEDWFEKIIGPFSRMTVDVVSGFYNMIGSSSFQKCLLPYLGTHPKALIYKNFFPSTRSIAFKKKIWKKVGGFWERLDKAGEDTYFNYSIKKEGAISYFENRAMVDWVLPTDLWTAIKKFYFYAKGDAQTKIWWDSQKKLGTHNLKILTVFLRYLLGVIAICLAITNSKLVLLPFFLFSLYLIWIVSKNYYLVKIWQGIIWLPIIQICSDFAVMAGFVKGIIS
ncbi:MAG: glycosyltransferase [Candidatus Pacebacteria bacterium]|nr:glycosyltransferase [Candidatus Paceibacterota bacterium]